MKSGSALRQRDGSARGTNQSLGAFRNQLQSPGKIGTKSLHLALHGGDRRERIAVVGTRRNIFSGDSGRGGNLGLAVGHAGHHIDEKPLPQAG